ncbi:NifB/NifX family molybdenum-iron cluster-binding protein [Desulfobacula sp.]
MTHQLSIPIYHEEVAPRFDLATEVLIMILSKNHHTEEKKNIILSRSSADDLCHLLLSEHTNTLICGAIEDEYYQFLKWKKIDVYDSIAGSWSDAFCCWKENRLKPGDILSHRIIEGTDV